MAVVGWEVLAIVGVLVIVLIWGPDRLPKIARAIGLARKELEDSKKQIISPDDEKEP